MNKVAICVHDMKLSDGWRIINEIDYIRREFNQQLVTFHIILDINIIPADPVIRHIQYEVNQGILEVVFHGTTHKTNPPGAWPWLKWYHNDEAEFIGQVINEQVNQNRFAALNRVLSAQPSQSQEPAPQTLQNSVGICPSCWIASKNGWRFIKSTNPAYRERLLCIIFRDSWFVSLPLSIATINTLQRFFLNLLVKFFTWLTGIFNCARTRLVVHKVELHNQVSMNLFKDAYQKLLNKGFAQVLQRELRQ
jgi:hypothetical protein